MARPIILPGMNSNFDQLARRLESELGPGTVSADSAVLAKHVVDGGKAAIVCSPQTAEQVVAALRICSETESAVTPWGGGTAMRIGNLPNKLDVIVGLSRLNRIIEHDAANLTATVEAGVGLPDLQLAVAAQKQFLCFDAPFSVNSTVGGTIAANLNGPRRSAYGSVRDLVIGVKVALVTGEHIKGGGKVVKNVAGYDMCKLFVGSLGTLGIITEATLRMSPLPEAARTMSVSGPLSEVLLVADEISHSKLNPTAVYIQNSKEDGTVQDMNSWQVAIWSEGFEQSVVRHLDEVKIIAERKKMRSAELRDESHVQFWGKIRDFPLRPNRIVYRVTVPPALVPEVLKVISVSESGDLEIVSDVLFGTVWIAAEPSKQSAALFSQLITLARERHGHAIMFSAPERYKEEIDIWGPPPPTLSIMREVKRQFDPKGLLNPGRFLTGV